MKTDDMKNKVIGLVLVVVTCAIWIGIDHNNGPTEPHPVHSVTSSSHEVELSPEIVAHTEELLNAYEQAREALASDDLPAANSAGEGLASIIPIFADSELPHLFETASAAQELSLADNLEVARSAFGEISEGLIATMINNPSLQQGRTLFYCPMVPDGFPNWVQPTPELDNPYMGLSMSRCGNSERWPEPASEGDAEVAYYTCPMHTSVRSDGISTCPICAMDLVPVSVASLLSGEVVIDGQRRQSFGVRTTAIHMGPMVEILRLPARVEWDPSTTHQVNIRADGWIEGLRVSDVGEAVRSGQVLFTLYSPELISAQGELLAAVRTHGPDHPTSLAGKSRLRVLGLTAGDIERIIEAGVPSERVNIRSPQSGVITEINLTEGAHVTAGVSAMVIGQTNTAVVEADLYESHLANISAGTEALVSFPALHSAPISAVVDRVDPWLDPQTHTARARLLVDNSEGALVAGMDADVSLHIDRGDSLLLPASAVIFNGDDRVVFIDMGDGRLTPTHVTLGARSNDLYQVLEGLETGDQVVTSGTFLVAAESRIYSASTTWAGGGDE